MALKKRNVNKLIKALRSGNYYKISGKLRNKDGFDTLGLACEVYRLSVGKGKWAKVSSSIDGEMTFGLRAKPSLETLLPDDVTAWYGFDDECPALEYKGKTTLVIDLNDFHKLTFAKIADVLEKNL